MQENEIKIRPLTHCSSTGELLRRSSEVEKQIVAAIGMDAADLIDKVRIRGHDESGFIQEEPIVHLTRNFHRQGDESMVEPLVSELIRRISKKIDHSVRIHLDPALVDECYRDVVVAVLAGVLEIETDKEDFAEVRFWPWLKWKLLGVLRTHVKRQRERDLTDSFTEFEDSGEDEISKRLPPVLVDPRVLPDVKADLLEALDLLTDKERTVYIMRHVYGWPTESQKQGVMTIERYYGVTPRTVRNWFQAIDEKIAKWHKGRNI